ncbi:MAG TPA: sigma-54 dependent transcriptional regulator [Planctomycetota bacterium]|nr:sigma-54 dependent transcriptional regulator [Planctomycetota bacterium]
MPKRIAVLEAPEGALADLVGALRETAADKAVVDVSGAIAELVASHARQPLDLVLLDYLRGDGARNGREALIALRAQDPELAVIAVADRGDVGLAAEAVKAGASDFLVRGDKLDERVATLLRKLHPTVELVHRHRALREQYRLLHEAASERYRIVGSSARVREVLERIARVARIPRPVLILGERGTGKELVARAIHDASGRGDRPFLAVNCAAFPETLLESELFGFEKGAFSGAASSKPGRLEAAHGGTLFLDEIGNMPLAFQQKILRVIEYGTFHRLGGQQELRSSARILAATNTDLERAIRDGRFLQDLYDRLAFEVVRVPALRERDGDIEVLARHFLDEFVREVPSLGAKRLSPGALALLRRHAFPGNVRELKSTVERAAYRDRTSVVDPEDIDLPESASAEAVGFEERVDSFKRRQIQEAMTRAGGLQRRAARELGLSYDQFRYYLRKYGPEARPLTLRRLPKARPRARARGAR